MKTERETEFDKIKVKVLIGDKIDATFSIKGGTYKFSSKGLTDREHELLSKAYRGFVENKDIKLPPSIKFNMIENCIHKFSSLSELVEGFTTDEISISGQYFPLNVANQIIGEVHMKLKKDRETVRQTMDRIKKERAPARSKAASKYVYPEGMSSEDKRRYRAKARAEARRQTAD